MEPGVARVEIVADFGEEKLFAVLACGARLRGHGRKLGVGRQTSSRLGNIARYHRPDEVAKRCAHRARLLLARPVLISRVGTSLMDLQRAFHSSIGSKFLIALTGL